MAKSEQEKYYERKNKEAASRKEAARKERDRISEVERRKSYENPYK